MVGPYASLGEEKAKADGNKSRMYGLAIHHGRVRQSRVKLTQGYHQFLNSVL